MFPITIQKYHSWCSKIAAHVALPDFAAGAMENWGLLMYREAYLLYDPMTSSAANKELIALVVSHEIAHMVRLLNYLNMLNLFLSENYLGTFRYLIEILLKS